MCVCVFVCVCVGLTLLLDKIITISYAYQYYTCIRDLNKYLNHLNFSICCGVFIVRRIKQNFFR